MSDNVSYMWYGLFAAWAIMLIYVLLLNMRERKLRDELDRVRRMVEESGKRS
ncbi:MAG: hypothetical protein ABL967_13265 [Bryobacteraceae bacterium]